MVFSKKMAPNSPQLFIFTMKIHHVILFLFSLQTRWSWYKWRQRGLTRWRIRQLPQRRYKPDKETTQTCPICLEDFKEGEKLRVLPCDHSKYTYIHVCMYMYMYSTYIHVHVLTYTCTYIYMYLHIHVLTYTCIHVHVIHELTSTTIQCMAFGATLKIHTESNFDQNQFKVDTQHKNMYVHQKKGKFFPCDFCQMYSAIL